MRLAARPPPSLARARRNIPKATAHCSRQQARRRLPAVMDEAAARGLTGDHSTRSPAHGTGNPPAAGPRASEGEQTGARGRAERRRGEERRGEEQACSPSVSPSFLPN
ncbi:hypothetical protein AAFF_G00221070 [Aldrovandia affinis]|uniref:Uncharacterized protein n=1 Tax=Aldrovandia affinis TaxID=143900 RepID=A0AAD7RGB6_9TELE|nr:hypothetical protein AAFF_G00221070 [Aldrovandia affinis]